MMSERVFLNPDRTGQSAEAASSASSALARPPALATVVRAVRSGREDHPVPVIEEVLPDGAVHVLFDLGRHPVGTVHGPTMAATALELAGTIDQVGVELAPGAVAAVLGVPAWSLRGCTWALADVLGPQAEQWLARLLEAPFGRRLEVVTELLVTRLAAAPVPDSRAAAAYQALTRPATTTTPGERNPSVPALADRVGLSARQLEQVFRNTVGLSPTEVTRLSRFHRLCRLLGANWTRSLADAAYEAGYADQAHASREAKRMSGLTLAGLRDREFVQDSPGVAVQADGHEHRC